MIKPIEESDFRIIKPIFFNTPGKGKRTKIGDIAVFKPTGELIYLTYRGGGIHFMKKYQGLGIDSILVDKFLSSYQDNMNLGGEKSSMKIVFFYDGIREHRYYYITVDELKKVAVKDGFASERDFGIMSWGSQLFVKMGDLRVFGYAKNDEVMLKWENFIKN